MASRWRKNLNKTGDLTSFVNGFYSLLTHRQLPPTSGTFQIVGLNEPVEIITDQYGVPHIYANNEDDLYFAQGYIHAQERLWQMDLNRRLGSGRLSEIFGTVTLEVDRFCRRLGMHRAAAADVSALPEHDLLILEAYASGVNSFIEHNQHKLPVEFRLLNYRPEPWKPADTLQWGKVQGWSLCGNWETELIRARIIEKVGVERAAQLEPGYDPQHPLILPPGVAYQGINLGLLEQYQQIQTLSGFSVMGGSNNWVVDGSMTKSGAPLLCNDPHLGQAAPSIWFECHLIAGELDVTGATFPGAPGIIIGHNQHIAWGVTNAVSDVQDLYVEKFNPENPRQYEFAGQWEEAEIIREEITIKGQDMPVVEEVRVTRHGPVITHIPAVSQPQTTEGQTSELPLALRWTGLEHTTLLTAIRHLNRASNWQEFHNALRDWDTPPQNFVYADREGNIGYVMAGSIPVRAKGQALIPVPGWNGEYEWTGKIPFEKLPQTYNPDQHFLVTANHRVIDDNYPYYITNEWLNGYRAQRIQQLLTSTEKITVEDMAKIQYDQYCIPATEIVPYILQLEANTAMKRAAQEILQTWDYQLRPDSIGASIYTTFARKLERLVLDALLGEDETLIQQYLGKSLSALGTLNGYAGRNRPLLLRLLREQPESWFANSVFPKGPNTWQVALDRAFDATLEELREKLGGNILRWQYGAIHKMKYTHPLGTAKALETFFNRGPFAVGGDHDTVNVGSATVAEPENVLVVPSYRQIIDLDQLSQSRSIHAPGQSGHPGSKHYDDFIALWRTGETHPMYYHRKEIEEHAEGKLSLNPKKL
ncbi:penicillin acylase family protein [Dictyobacter kobayashii]|uniref:Peptidase S45 n=1 Tax=Dictyobacter kobayashii TaxID=2014872 RepID=A0A402AMD9_9CHLR|nr:penicillin acylase family protein [Dictyobacter kobayashii]GCE20286.1 peptidase S45 [Dictyobacter kobayashii]